LWDKGDEVIDVLEALCDVVSLEFWEGGGGAVLSDLLELCDELHNVTEDSLDIEGGDVIDCLLDEWENSGDVLDALWADTVGGHNFFGLGAVGDGFLDEGDEFCKVGHHFSDITG